MTAPCVRATVRIDARRDVVYRLITDLPTHREHWDRRPGWLRKAAGKATGVSDRVIANTEHIGLTLQRLKQRAETE